MKTLYETARDSLIVIESIASGSTTTNSLPHLARLAREGLTAIESADRAQQGEPVDERAAFEAWAERIGIAYSNKQRGLCFYDANLGHGSWVGWQGRATKAAAPADATQQQVGRAALMEFIDKYCLGKSELVACAESAFYWFNKVATKAAAPDDAPTRELLIVNDQGAELAIERRGDGRFMFAPIGPSGIRPFYRATPAPDTGIPTAGEDELSLQQVADLINGKGIMSPAEFSRFLNGDGVEMFPHQIAFMCNLFAGRAPVSTTPTSGEVESVGCIKCPRDPSKICDYCGYKIAAPSHPSEAKAGEKP